MGDVSLMTLLAMGKTCPYMPTNFREFLRVASEMGPALTPLETTGSSSNLHSTAAQQQQQQSANGQSNGQGDAPAGGVRPQLQLPPMVSEEAAAAAAAAAVAGAGGAAGESASGSSGSGFWRSDVRSSAESRLQRVQSGRSSLDSRLLQQSGWSDLLSPTRHSEHYRQVHARDGINEMHPGVITNRLSLRDAASAGGDAGSSDGAKTKGLASTAEGEEGADSSTASNTAANAATSSSSPVRTGKVKRRQFSLDLNIRAGSSSSGSSSGHDGSSSGGRRTTQGGPQRRHVRGGAGGSGGGSGSASTEELAHILSKSSLTDLVEMEDDSDSCSGSGRGGGRGSSGTGSGHTTLSPSSATGSGFAGSPGSPTDNTGGSSSSSAAAAPSQILFTHEEIIVLKLIFSLFDRKGKDTITREDIVAYAEEGGDYAQLKEVDACMEAVDADGDGNINLHDYINFAARLKAISALQAMASAQEEEAAEQERLAAWEEQANEDQQQ
jgi:hypothetical protein